jgi:hypothetical protein
MSSSDRTPSAAQAATIHRLAERFRRENLLVHVGVFALGPLGEAQARIASSGEVPTRAPQRKDRTEPLLATLRGHGFLLAYFVRADVDPRTVDDAAVQVARRIRAALRPMPSTRAHTPLTDDPTRTRTGSDR